MNVCKWCGNKAEYFFKITKTYCCKPYPQQCPEFRKILSTAKKGKKRSQESIMKQSTSMKGISAKPKYRSINTTQLCSYKCGKTAKYIFNNGKYCCQDNYRKCKGFIKNKEFKKKWSPKAKLFLNKDNILCSFGCGKIAKHIFKNGKYCCSEYVSKCINIKPHISNEVKEKLSKLNKKPLVYWKTQYPLFSKVEELKEDEYGEIVVQCKNEKCKQWFKPTYVQLYERIRQVESEYGNGGLYFYCSDECKNSCILYGLKSDPYSENELPYTQEEYNIWNRAVLEQDIFECQKCGSKENLHCHHINPVKTHPHLALDPTNEIVLISAPVNGKVMEIKTKKGDTVNKGDVLLVIQ